MPGAGRQHKAGQQGFIAVMEGLPPSRQSQPRHHGGMHTGSAAPAAWPPPPFCSLQSPKLTGHSSGRSSTHGSHSAVKVADAQSSHKNNRTTACDAPDGKRDKAARAPGSCVGKGSSSRPQSRQMLGGQGATIWGWGLGAAWGRGSTQARSGPRGFLTSHVQWLLEIKGRILVPPKIPRLPLEGP